jgi:quercetin dioxygenase-like cupin family protein
MTEHTHAQEKPATEIAEKKEVHWLTTDLTGFVRKVDYTLYPPERFKSEVLYWGERGFVIASRVPPGQPGPVPHTHTVDQMFFCYRGELELTLGDQVHTLTPGSLAMITTGVPHKHRNPGAVDEMHLELLVPGILPGLPIVEVVADDGSWGPGGYVVRIDDAKFEPTEIPGWSEQWMIPRSSDPEAAGIVAGLIAPGGGFEALRVREVSEYLFVLAGEIEVRINDDVQTVGPDNLILLPAGLPHAIRNVTPADVRYVSAITADPGTAVDA